MNYQVEAAYLVKITETLTSKAGQPYKSGSLEDNTGKIYGFLAYPRYSQYEKIIEGAMIDCALTPTSSGDKYFVNDLKEKKPLSPPAFVAQRRAGIAEAVREKQIGIKESQERKKDAIRIAGTMRDATLIALAEFVGSPLVANDFQIRWNYWQAWLEKRGDELDRPEHKPPF